MSYAKLVKEEISNINSNTSESLAEVSAFLHLNSEILIHDGKKMIDFKTTNPTVAKRFLSLIKKLYETKSELMTKKEEKLNRKYSIIVRITGNIDKILSEHNILDSKISERDLILFDDDTKRAYLRGAFLSSGSVNDPKKSEYHLELFCATPNEAVYLQKIINHFDLNAKITKRRKGFICYLKNQESIGDFINLIGANMSYLKYEDLILKRNFSNSINRVINCELANEKKVYQTAVKQLKEINILEKNSDLVIITERLKRAIDIRKENPDVSLNELVIRYENKYNEPITKSGLNHRFQKIKELAYEILENKTI